LSDKMPVRYTGPYEFKSGRNKGRKYMTVFYSDGSHGTTLYSRYLYQLANGIVLNRAQTVDHVNEDNTDDRIANFQLLTKEENASKSSRKQHHITWVEFVCPECGCLARKNARVVKYNSKYRKCGPFCSRSCSGKAGRRKQIETKTGA